MPHQHVFKRQAQKQNCQRMHQPRNSFSFFADMELLEYIVRETNRFPEQSQVEAKKRNPLWTNPLTVAEFKAWLGLLVGMGIKQLPQVSHHWSKEWVLGVPSFASVMTRDRFLVILRYLHFSDNSKMPARGQPGFDKLYKVRPVLLSLKTRSNNSTVLTTFRQLMKP